VTSIITTGSVKRMNLKKGDWLHRLVRRHWSNVRCELGEVVDAELLLNLGDLIYNLEKPIVSEKRILLLLEFLAERIKLVCGDNAAEGWKENGVFARFVRTIHADKLTHRIGELAAFVSVFERPVRSKAHRDVSEPSPRLMLLQKHLD
jgi:hypothetical protein